MWRNMSSGTLFDLSVLGFLMLQTFLGWRRGFLWQVAGVASITFGVILGLFLAPYLSGWVHTHITSNLFHAKLMSFFFVLGLTGFLLRMAASIAEVHSERNLPKKEKDLRRADDRILGGIFGALKGSVTALMVVAAAYTFFPQWSIWKESTLAEPMAVAGSRLLPNGAVREAARWSEHSAKDLRVGLDIQ